MNKVILTLALGLMGFSSMANATQGVCDDVQSVWSDAGGLLFDLRHPTNAGANGNKYKAFLPGPGDVRLTCDMSQVTSDGLTGGLVIDNCTAKSPGGPATPFPIVLDYNFSVTMNTLVLEPLYLGPNPPIFTLLCVK